MENTHIYEEEMMFHLLRNDQYWLLERVKIDWSQKRLIADVSIVDQFGTYNDEIVITDRKKFSDYVGLKNIDRKLYMRRPEVLDFSEANKNHQEKFKDRLDEIKGSPTKKEKEEEAKFMKEVEEFLNKVKRNYAEANAKAVFNFYNDNCPFNLFKEYKSNEDAINSITEKLLTHPDEVYNDLNHIIASLPDAAFDKQKMESSVAVLSALDNPILFEGYTKCKDCGDYFNPSSLPEDKRDFGLCQNCLERCPSLEQSYEITL